MSDTKQLVAAVFALVVALGLGSGRQAADVAPTSTPSSPAVSTSLDLAAAFNVATVSAGDRRRHAADLARVFQIAADCVRWDSERPEVERDFARVEDVDKLVVNVRHFLLREWSFAENYPQLGPTVGDFLKRRLEGPTGPLTSDARRTWLEAMAEIRAACAAVEAS